MPEYEPIRDDSTVLTREMIDRLMRAYTGTGGMMYQGVQGTTTAEWCAECPDYDPLAHAHVLNIPQSFTFSVTASEVNPRLWELFTSDDTDGQEPEPDPEPCTETELTDFLGI